MSRPTASRSVSCSRCDKPATTTLVDTHNGDLRVPLCHAHYITLRSLDGFRDLAGQRYVGPGYEPGSLFADQ